MTVPISYLGRIDDQVKIRGFRIELGEIESRIREIRNINDCAVIVRNDTNGEKAIYAYYTGDAEVGVSEIRESLSVNLPNYMIPAYMMQIDSIPVTRNGKLDRRALPEIEVCPAKAYSTPRNKTEERICEIFSEILGVEKVGINDSFFELGGHSLKATKLVNRIEERTGIRIALKDVFSYTTPEQLAKLVGADGREQFESIPKASPKEYYPMSSAQKRMYYINQMQPEATAYNISFAVRITGNIDIQRMADSVQKLVDNNEILRTSFITIDSVPIW